MLRWSGQNATKKLGRTKCHPQKKSGQNANLGWHFFRLAFCLHTVFWCYPMRWGLVIWGYIALVAINTKFPGRSSLGKNVFLSCLDFWASQQLWSCPPSSWWSPTSSSSWSAATMTTTTLPTSFPNAQVLTQVNCGHHQILGARLTLKYFDNLWQWSSHQTVLQALVVSLGRDSSDPDSDPRQMEIVGSTSNCKVYLRHCHP